MNWRGWLLGFVIMLLQTSMTAFNIVGQFPNTTEYQMVIILYPVVVGMIVTFLVKSPIPGAVLPPGIVNGVQNPLPLTK
jgi:hypothetical protein